MVATANRRHPPEGPRAAAPSSQEAKGRCLGDFLRCVKDARGDGWYSVNGVVDGRRVYNEYEAKRRIDKVYQTGYVSSPPPAVAKAALNESSGTAGGYLLPQDYSTQLLVVIAENSFLYRRAQKVPLETREGSFPRWDNETVQAAGTAPFFGGTLFKWGSEQAPQETEPKYRALGLTAWDLLGYVIASNDWLGDTGPAGEAALVQMFGKAAAWYAEYAFFNGTGTAGQMPLGIINSPGTVTVTRSTGNQIKVADIATMASKLLPYSWRGAVWAASPTTLAQIIAITNYFINLDAHDEANAGSLLTRPVFVTDKLAALGSAGDLLLFDPWLYVVGLRQEVIVDVSEHASFQSNQTNFRVWLRLDGKPYLSSPVTLADGSTKVSPFVMLV